MKKSENQAIVDNAVESTNSVSRGKSFVAFVENDDKTFTYEGRYVSLSDFSKKHNDEGVLTNNLRPVLSGKVRIIKKYTLFYEKYSELDHLIGYDEWLAEDDTRQHGDFPDEIYFSKGYIRGLSTRVPMQQVIEQLEKLGWSKK